MKDFALSWEQDLGLKTCSVKQSAAPHVASYPIYPGHQSRLIPERGQTSVNFHAHHRMFYRLGSYRLFSCASGTLFYGYFDGVFFQKFRKKAHCSGE